MPPMPASVVPDTQVMNKKHPDHPCPFPLSLKQKYTARMIAMRVMLSIQENSVKTMGQKQVAHERICDRTGSVDTLRCVGRGNSTAELQSHLVGRRQTMQAMGGARTWPQQNLNLA